MCVTDWGLQCVYSQPGGEFCGGIEIEAVDNPPTPFLGLELLARIHFRTVDLFLFCFLLLTFEHKILIIDYIYTSPH